MLIFSFDAETDGLYGDVWAIGATVHDGDTAVANFRGQLDPSVVADPWTRENVVPVVNLPRYGSRGELLEEFWAFWMTHRNPEGAASGTFVALADCGYPVESGLFRACVELDLEARRFQGPFPLHELSTALLAAGHRPDVDRREYVGRPDLTPHDPVADATVAALCWRKAFG